MQNVEVVESTRLVHPLIIKCDRCNGQGFLERYSYKAKGRCFGCGGTGKRRDYNQVIKETRITIHAPVGLSVVSKLVPSPENSPKTVAPPPRTQNPLAGLSWSEQARLRATQNASTFSS